MISKARAKAMQSRFPRRAGKAALAELRAYWDELLGKYQVKTAILSSTTW